MKRSVLILITIISVSIGCQVDKSGLPSSGNSPLLVGTWYLKSEVIAGIIQGNPSPPDTITGFSKSDYYKFNADNTVNTSTLNPPVIYTSYYNLSTTSNGQQLIIGGSNSKSNASYTVNKLSKDSLILYNTNSQTLSGISVVTNTTSLYTH